MLKIIQIKNIKHEIKIRGHYIYSINNNNITLYIIIFNVSPACSGLIIAKLRKY